jgi:hypothetical protein
VILTGSRYSHPILRLLPQGLALLWTACWLLFSMAVLITEKTTGTFQVGWHLLIPLLLLLIGWLVIRAPLLGGAALVAAALSSVYFFRLSAAQPLNALLIAGWPLAAGILLLAQFCPRRIPSAD